MPFQTFISTMFDYWYGSDTLDATKGVVIGRGWTCDKCTLPEEVCEWI